MHFDKLSVPLLCDVYLMLSFINIYIYEINMFFHPARPLLPPGDGAPLLHPLSHNQNSCTTGQKKKHHCFFKTDSE